MTRIDSLDVLRGVAITAVFAFHVSITALLDLDRPSWIAKIGGLFGWIGVDLFFVLSGFLITRIVLEARGSDSFFGAFWARRALRIFPAYYTFLLVMLILLPLLGWQGIFQEPATPIPELSYWLFLSSIFMAMAGDHGLKPLSIAWSLAVEMQFYLLWPPVARFLSLRALRYTIAVLLVAAFIGRIVALSAGVEEIAIFVLIPFRCDGLLAGASIACLLAEGKSLPKRSSLWVGATTSGLLLAGGLLSGISFVYQDPVLISLKYTAVAAFCYCVVSLALSRGEQGRQRAPGRILSVFGALSYGIYLWHYAAILVAATLLFPAGAPANGWIVFFLLFAAGALASLALAVLSWLAVETPALRYRQRFAIAGDRMARPQ